MRVAHLMKHDGIYTGAQMVLTPAGLRFYFVALEQDTSSSIKIRALHDSPGN
jgi:hypothetical protein